MGIVFEISADFWNSMMFYFGHFYYYFYSPPIQVDPAQKFRESCAFYQSFAVKARLINMSFSTGTFPTRWKTASVTPLFKQGVANDPSNYRPISVLPAVSKVIERHMHNSLYALVMDNNLLYSRQSGFRGMYSTETSLIKLVDELFFGLDNNRVCGMLLVDYRKALDMVDRELLLRKLELYSVVNRELAWCHSYLLDRKQMVRVKWE